MDDNYRRQMIDAGRGHLVAGPPLRSEPFYLTGISRCVHCHGDIAHGHHGIRFPGDCSYPQSGIENDPED